ncbi:hypothetical protein [Isoptericola sp. NPDC057191]|uniref:hypothetical protein n=1 Tax=Isoptericola sp. NPDC057191 TaxID=3346041 RepID=UPI003639EF53
MTTRRKHRKNDRITALARGRVLHLVDVENVCGTGVLTTELVWDARARLHASQSASNAHHWVLGASSSSNAAALAGWGNARCVLQHGTDGADRALIAVLDEQTITRYGSVVVYSGDGIFAEPLARLAVQGIDTTVVARPEQLAARLRLAAHRVVLLPPLVAPSAPYLAA